MSYLLFFPIVGALFFLFSSLIGGVLFDSILNSEKSNLFLAVLSPFIGTVLTVSIFSIVYSSFITVNLFAVFLLISIFVLNYKRGVKLFQFNSFREILINSSRFFFLFMITMILSVYYDYTEILNLDFLFYSGVVIDGIENTGVENVYGYFNNYLSGDVLKPIPYHYFEFWLAVLFKKILTKYTSVIILKYLVYVFFKTFFILGLYNLFKHFKPKLSFWFVIIILLCSYIPIDAFFNLFTNGWDIHASFWQRPNFLTYQFVVVSALPFLLEKKYLNFSLVLLFLPVVSITTAPVIFSATFAFLIIMFWMKKITFKNLLIALGITVILAFFIVLFYYLLGEKSISVLSSELSILEYYKSAWKAMIYYVVTLSVISLVPLFISGYINFKYIKNILSIDLILFPFISIVFGVIIFQLLYFIDNSYQFTYIGYTYLYVVLMIVIIGGVMLTNKLKYLFYIFPIIGIITFVIDFNSVDLTNISLHNFYKIEKKKLNNFEYSKLEKGGVAIVLVGKDGIENVLPKKRQLLTNVPFSSLLYLGDYKIIPLVDSNLLYTPLKNNESETFKKAHDFNDRLPAKWKCLDYINEIILKENVNLVVYPKNNNEMRERIKILAKDSIDIGEKRILFM